MPQALKVLDRILFVTIGALLGAMVLDVTVQGFFRYVIEKPPTWTEELARFLFAWQIFLGAGLAFGRGSHIVVDALLLVLPKGGRRVLAVLTNVIVLGFLAVLIWQGTSMTLITADTYSTAMRLNMGVVYAALPLGAAISAVYVGVYLVAAIRGVELHPTPSSLMVD
jgi:TRAP-type C4-dicarboxylate transport system permease small subunit